MALHRPLRRECGQVQRFSSLLGGGEDIAQPPLLHWAGLQRVSHAVCQLCPRGQCPPARVANGCIIAGMGYTLKWLAPPWMLGAVSLLGFYHFRYYGSAAFLFFVALIWWSWGWRNVRMYWRARVRTHGSVDQRRRMSRR